MHGCVEELRELLDAVRPAEDGRRVVFVGDLVAKGPDSKGVLAVVRETGALSVRGNHDQHVIRWREAQERGTPPPRLGPAHREVTAVLDDDDWALLRALPYRLSLDDVGALVVHAGLVPGVPLEAQDPEWLLTLRSIRPDGSPTKRAEEGVPWASLWPGPELVLFGHDAMRGLQQHPHAVGLDTGCVYGGQLTGYLLPERRLVQIAAKRAWSGEAGG